MQADCQVWVAEGTYYPTDGGMPDDRTASFTLDGQYVYGGFSGIELALDQRDWVAHPTILSGDLGVPDVSSDNSHHVVTSETGGWLDGFEIRNGSTEGLSVIAGRDGVGILHGLGGSLAEMAGSEEGLCHRRHHRDSRQRVLGQLDRRRWRRHEQLRRPRWNRCRGDGGSVVVVDSVFESNFTGVGGSGPNAPGSPGGHGW